MRVMKVQLELHYDDCGNVVGYKMENINNEVVTLEVHKLDDPVVANPERVVGERLIGALNTEFGFPPILGMPR